MEKQPEKRIDGIIHIHASNNNTIIVISDAKGNVKEWISGGRLGLKGAARATAFAAERMTRWVIKKVQTLAWQHIKIWVQGFGQGRYAAIRGLTKKRTSNIVLIKDVTPVAYGGCRAKKRRRI